MPATARKTHIHAIAFDRGSARTIDAQGFLHVEGCNISKATVNPYWGEEIPDCEALGLDPQKVYYLFRDPKELEKAAATFNDLPLMDNHIEVSAEDFEKDKVHGKIVGTTGSNARFEDPYLVNELVVWTAGGIQGVMSKEQTQLSCAYRYELDMTPGEYRGQKYDGRMFNLQGNHVALVDEGRAGPDVVVKDQKPKKPIVDIKSVAKLVADALAPVKKVIGMAYDCIPEIIEQLTAVKATIESKLKPGVEGEDAKVLDDCTSAIDLAIHHLLDFQEDKDAKGTVVQEDETHGHYAGEYGAAAKHANTVGQAAGSKGGPSHKEAQAAHQKAAVAANKEGNASKTSDHLRVAAAHSALHSDPGNVMAKGVLAGHYGAKAKDAGLASDKIEHREGHKDSNGKPAPWVIVSESNGRVIWSGTSKEDAVSNLRRIEGHKMHAKDSVIADETHGHYAGEYGSVASKATKASESANQASAAAKERVFGTPRSRQEQRAANAYQEAARSHQKAAEKAEKAGEYGRADHHNNMVKVHTKAAGQHQTRTNAMQSVGDSVVADIAEREDVSPKAGKTKYGEVKFADPKNKKYPIDNPDHVRSALSYWGRPENRNMYSEEDQATITKRIDTVAKRFKIGKYAESK